MDSHLVITSLLFLSVGIHALYKKLYDYGIAWILLSITSTIVHGMHVGLITDKVLVYTVIVFGACYYARILKNNVKEKAWTAVLAPPLLFIACVCLYFKFTHIDHVWVHIASILGHHMIIRYV
jgi:hypothetical protein